MRLSISNIAWDTAEDESIALLLQQFAIDAIDVAPSKYFPVSSNVTNEEIGLIRHWWAARGIQIIGMQALLFGTTGLNVFGSAESQAALLEHLESVCRIGSVLGATRLVFGSPKNRDRSGLKDEEALQVAIPFFRHLGDIAQTHGVMICLEPNPARYGANFMTTSAETAQVVELVGNPSIKMQLDIGALATNGEDPFVVLRDYSHLIGHVHASERDLLPLGDGDTDHRQAAEALNQHLLNPIVTIEMLATKNETHVQSIERALKLGISHYRHTVTEKLR